MIKAMKMNSYKDIDEYINNFPKDTQQKLQKIREVITRVTPEAKEKISYGIPTFWSGRNIVHFAAYDAHIGFYPGAKAIADFAEDLKPYETSKGTVRFPLDKPIPYDIIEKITLYCAQISKKS